MPGNRGYKYFGAAKDLPGVRELFDGDAAPSGKKTRAELMKDRYIIIILIIFSVLPTRFLFCNSTTYIKYNNVSCNFM